MADRNLAEVLDEMIALVPDDQCELKEHLIHYRKSCVYQAPEVMHKIWGRVVETLAAVLGVIPPDWALPMLKVFMGANWPVLCKELGIDPERG